MEEPDTYQIQNRDKHTKAALAISGLVIFPYAAVEKTTFPLR